MTKLQEAISDYLCRYADEQNLSQKSRKSRRLLMNRIYIFFAGKEFDLQNCRAFLEKVRETNSPSSMKSYVKDIHAFIRFLFRYEYIQKDFSSMIPMPRVQDSIRKFITESEAKEAILAGTEPSIYADNRYAQKSKKECRMGLLFILFTGLRISELRKLQVEDFSLSEKVFTVQSKGGKVELANIPMNMIEPLREWIAEKKTGRMFEVSEDSLRIALHRGTDKLGLIRQRVHDLRHIYSLTRLRRKEPMQLVSRTLRHKKLSTTDKYYSQYMITDLESTANNSPEIQKSVSTETVLDGIEQVLKNFGVRNDPRFKFIRENGRVSIETKG